MSCIYKKFKSYIVLRGKSNSVFLGHSLAQFFSCRYVNSNGTPTGCHFIRRKRCLGGVKSAPSQAESTLGARSKWLTIDSWQDWVSAPLTLALDILSAAVLSSSNSKVLDITVKELRIICSLVGLSPFDYKSILFKLFFKLIKYAWI